jgi:hypothetical protein
MAQVRTAWRNCVRQPHRTLLAEYARSKLHLLHSWNTVSRGLKMFLLGHGISISAALSVFVMLAPARVSHAGNTQQCEAPAHNNGPYKNPGIETAYRFASLANRRITGLLAHFTMMPHSPTSNPMLNYMVVQYGPLQIITGRARQPVILPTRPVSASATFSKFLRNPHRSTPRPTLGLNAKRAGLLRRSRP